MMSTNILSAVLMNSALAAVFLLSILEDKIKPNLPIFDNPAGQKIPISIRPILFALVVLFPLALLLLLKGTRDFLTLLTFFLFSICILSHALWIALGLKKSYKILIVMFAGLIIITRFFSSSQLVHDLFITLVVIWLGPFIVSIHKFLTRRIFLAVSALWFLYDVYYVWVSATVHKLNITTQPFLVPQIPPNFSLSLVALYESIGLADLFYAVLLLAIVKEMRHKVLAALLFIGSNIALEIYAYSTGNFSAFPLLVLWVPLGLGVLLLERRQIPTANLNTPAL